MLDWLGWIELVQHELLLFCGIWFLLGALDDIAIDLIWIIRRAMILIRKERPATRLDQWGPPKSPGLIAVFLPLWDEGAVAAQMLATCRARWHGQNYRLFAGYYPNDPATCLAVQAAARKDPKLIGVVNTHIGPTTKADCLNMLWAAMIAFEATIGQTAKAIVLHDAEDLVHPDEIALYDRLIEQFELVQLPVRAVAVPGSALVSGHYCDEFVEAHDKQLVVRSWLGAGLPSAGVGCAFSRAMLETVAGRENGLPFSAESLTEDYELGLKIRELGGRQTIAHLSGADGSLICTRSCFPASFRASTRQKARWLTGIALAGWDRLGWSARPAEFWMRLRDRRSIFAAYLLAAGYLAAILTLLLHGAALAIPGYQPTGLSSELVWMVALTFLALIWRLAVRTFLVARAYGWRDALLCAPRLLIGNLIAIVAATKALQNYAAFCFGHRLTWDKTSHCFPPAGEVVR